MSNDPEAVQALRTRDPIGVARLFRRHHPAMLAKARRICGRFDVAEEVVQEAWLAILDGIHRYEARSSLRWWMIRIVRNRAITRARRERRVVTEGSGGSVEQTFEHLACSAPDPEARYVEHETGRSMEHALTRLPPRQRRVLEMRTMEGRSAGEVCDALGVTPTNQRVMLHRARRNLRNAMA